MDARGIAQMFEELSGYDQYEEALCVRASFALSKRRASLKASKRRWERKYPEKRRALVQRHNDRHREHMHEVWRRNSKAYRARKRNGLRATIGTGVVATSR